MKSISDPHDEVLSLGATRSLVLWILFFLISLGLGYPTLNRYDARTADPDVISYYKMVANDPPPTAEDNPFRFRVLVPSVARPFYVIAKGKLGTWNPVFFGLLISNCLFTATATLFLLLIAVRVLADLPTALLGCALFLLNYVVSNSLAFRFGRLIRSMPPSRRHLVPVLTQVVAAPSDWHRRRTSKTKLFAFFSFIRRNVVADH